MVALDVHCFAFVTEHHEHLCRLLRAYPKHILKESIRDRDLHVRRGAALANLEKVGGVQLKLQSVQDELPYACDYCPARFSKKSARAVRMSALHGLKL